MLPGFGYLMLALGFLLTLYGLMVMLVGVVRKSEACVESARLALMLIFSLVSFSIVVMIVLLLVNRFDVVYVYQVTNQSMPAYLRLTALWGGQSGSLLFWSWLLAGFSMVFSISKRLCTSKIFPWSGLVLFIILGFFLGMSLFVDNPFERFWYLADGGWGISMFQPEGGWVLMPQDGQGLNPLLRHPGMILHPPALYLGFTGFAVPFALAVGSLAAGRKDNEWIKLSRPWLLFAWVFLSLGLVLGMWWAYDVLGWGGYWGWDPVEVSALLPWLSATALLHTAILQGQRKGYKRWNIALVALTFVLVVFSVFVTRSGVISSVHAFAESAVGLPLLVLLILLTLGSSGLLLYRWRGLRGEYGSQFGFNRETLTVFTSLVFLSILVVCFIGMIYPLGSELLTGIQMTVGETWYERITGPLFFLLLLLVGICPLAARSAASFKRNWKRLLIVVLISLVSPLAAWLCNVREAFTLAALWLAGFGALMTLSEYILDVSCRLHRSGGKVLRGLWEPIRDQTRRYGGLIVHLGIVLMSLGIIGMEGLQQETQVVLTHGESADLGGYQFTYIRLNTYANDEAAVTEAVLSVSRDGKEIGVLYSQREDYVSLNQSVMRPGVKSDLAVDLYTVLVSGVPLSEEEAAFTLYVTPLAKWLWVGTGVLTVGVVMAALPGRKHHKEKVVR